MSDDKNTSTWGPIDEIDVDMVPPIGATLWWDLYTELLLRLEQTDPSRALVLTFKDKKTLSSAASSLRRYFDMHTNIIELACRKGAGDFKLYVYYRNHKPEPPVSAGNGKKHSADVELIPFKSSLS